MARQCLRGSCQRTLFEILLENVNCLAWTEASSNTYWPGFRSERSSCVLICQPSSLRFRILGPNSRAHPDASWSCRESSTSPTFSRKNLRILSCPLSEAIEDAPSNGRCELFGGNALPTCRYRCALLPASFHSGGNDCSFEAMSTVSLGVAREARLGRGVRHAQTVYAEFGPCSAGPRWPDVWPAMLPGPTYQGASRPILTLRPFSGPAPPVCSHHRP